MGFLGGVDVLAQKLRDLQDNGQLPAGQQSSQDAPPTPQDGFVGASASPSNTDVGLPQPSPQAPQAQFSAQTSLPPRPGAIKGLLTNYLDTMSKQLQQQNQPQGFLGGFRSRMHEGADVASGVGDLRLQRNQQIANAIQLQQNTEYKDLQGQQYQPVQLPKNVADAYGWDVNKPLPANLAEKMLSNYSAQQTKRDISANQIASRQSIETMKERMKAGDVARWQPVQDASGKPVMRAYNKQGQPLFEVDDAFFPTLAQSVSSTVEYKEDGNGNLVALPKTTVTQKVLPGSQNVPRGTSARSSAPAGPRVVMPTKNAQKMVIGIDPAGNQVMVPRGDATRANLTNVAEAPSADVSKAIAARNWIPLASKTGSEPSKMGMIQLVDELDKRNALGPIASRWNEFSVGKGGFGTGNAETDRLIEALRVKAGLAKTLLMNLHVGNRGGAYLFEHFEDLANAGKMNANILKEGFKSELDYAKERAMMPQDKTLDADTAKRYFDAAGGNAAKARASALADGYKIK